ncbi:D-alanine--D-alanine ligase [Suttonella ornithocola]|uniref:D-alanine--D-alanine ligase n=1 Tax=Suttonella ornithocola TaxID=279832 RepID=A0A380MZA3_9GAMM|nr:D-alanine--D-alanine ligase [Suttonella ornithocola]SUO97233.1 D-alanine--D-alanine ligase B [Suttonella ornithocola]
MNPSMFGKVAVLYGGDSAEREVSLQSGVAVHQALLSRQVDAHLVDTRDHEAVLSLKKNGFSRAFVMLHGRGGEDGQIQGVLEWLGLPYTGSGIMACAIAMDKVMTKQVWAANGLPVLKDQLVTAQTQYDDLVEALGSDILAIKPSLEGSSVGISRVTDEASFKEALLKAGVDKQAVMAEPWITGRELTCGIVCDKLLPSIEIIASSDHSFYDYEAKYLADDTRYLCPAPISETLEKQLQEMTEKAFRVLGCSGWGRVDYLLDQNNRLWLLEINLSPGMTSHSLIPQAAAKAGMSFSDAVISVLSTTYKKQVDNANCC